MKLFPFSGYIAIKQSVFTHSSYGIEIKFDAVVSPISFSVSDCLFYDVTYPIKAIPPDRESFYSVSI